MLAVIGAPTLGRSPTIPASVAMGVHCYLYTLMAATLNLIPLANE